jgi:hypothetical protein
MGKTSFSTPTCPRKGRSSEVFQARPLSFSVLDMVMLVGTSSMSVSSDEKRGDESSAQLPKAEDMPKRRRKDKLAAIPTELLKIPSAVARKAGSSR